MSLFNLMKAYYVAKVRDPFKKAILFWETSIHPLASNLSNENIDNFLKYFVGEKARCLPSVSFLPSFLLSFIL